MAWFFGGEFEDFGICAFGGDKWLFVLLLALKLLDDEGYIIFFGDSEFDWVEDDILFNLMTHTQTKKS